MKKHIKNAPAIIWLNISYDVKEDENIDFDSVGDVTWSEDKSSENDIGYIKANGDLFLKQEETISALQKENETLKAENEKMKGAIDTVMEWDDCNIGAAQIYFKESLSYLNNPE